MAAFERETGHQIAVLTLPSLQGDTLEGFSIRVAEAWKIGQKGFDNGAILLIVRDDRKLRIEVGYGLEGVLPDAIANRIISEVIVPRFRENDYAGGIEAGVNAILQVTKGEPLPESARKSTKGGASPAPSLLTALTMTAILALFIGMTQRRLIGGAFGGAAAGLVATLVSAAGIGLGLGLALVVGAVLGAIGSTMSVASSGNQWTGSSRYRRGGGIFPGGFGGGGFGGGGFGGGGGGFSGGGGGFGGGARVGGDVEIFAAAEQEHCNKRLAQDTPSKISPMRVRAWDAYSRIAVLNRITLFIGLLLVLGQAKPCNALQVPPLRGRVNDLAGLLSQDQSNRLEEQLAQFEQQTGHQIAVLTIRSLEGDALEDFSIKVADAWKIGQKGFDNGNPVDVRDRKLRIEVGYGLEGVLPMRRAVSSVKLCAAFS